MVSKGDRKEVKKAQAEGRLAEAMLDRRAAMKRYVHLPPLNYSRVKADRTVIDMPNRSRKRHICIDVVQQDTEK